MDFKEWNVIDLNARSNTNRDEEDNGREELKISHESDDTSNATENNIMQSMKSCDPILAKLVNHDKSTVSFALARSTL